MRSWPLALLPLTMLVALTGCASRHIDAAPAKSSAAAQSNATVRKVTFFAAWVDERDAAPPAAAPPPALTPARESTDKRTKSGKQALKQADAAAARQEAGAKTAPAPRPAQPRYEYTVELDTGGYRTLIGQRDLGIHVNDRVIVQGNSVSAVASN